MIRRRPAISMRENEHAVLATWRRDGACKFASVTVGLDAAGRDIIASRETLQSRNLRRVRVPQCGSRRGLYRPVGSDGGHGGMVTLPEAMEPNSGLYGVWPTNIQMGGLSPRR